MTSDIRAFYEQYAYENCVPIYVMQELTLKCNLRCVHCYNFDRSEPLPAPNQSDELQTDRIVELMDEARELGTLFWSFTGGEAMAHPDFWPLVEQAIKRNFSVRVLTNATLIGREEAKRFASLGVEKVSTSFYGARPETHDEVTMKPGSFEQTLQAAKYLLEEGVSVLGKFVIMKINVEEVEEMRQLSDRIGMPYQLNASITPRHDDVRERGPLTTRISPARLKELYGNEMRDVIVEDHTPRRKGDFFCNCARALCAISSTGEVYPCIATPMSGGNVRKQSLPEIWNNSETFNWIRNLESEDFEHCAPCPVQTHCRRNNGQAFLESGEYTGIDPWKCREAEVIHDLVENESSGTS